MKEMYLKVEVEHSDYGDAVDVFFYKGRHFSCLEDDPQLVEIKDAEEKGAEKLHEAITVICFGDSDDVKGAFDGYCTVSNIIANFSLKEIIERVEKIKMAKHHVPTQGDVYRSKHTNNNVVVLSYNEKTRETRYVAHNYASREKEDYLNEHYYFTGENIDVSALVNKIG
jgi:hypothetical protein